MHKRMILPLDHLYICQLKARVAEILFLLLDACHRLELQTNFYQKNKSRPAKVSNMYVTYNNVYAIVLNANTKYKENPVFQTHLDEAPSSFQQYQRIYQQRLVWKFFQIVNQNILDEDWFCFADFWRANRRCRFLPAW